MRRRAALLGLVGVTLGGCGFHPLYLPQKGPGGVNALQSIAVQILLNRDGQLMRQALQRRLEGSSSGVAKAYDLSAQPSISGEGIGILRDNSTTRYRLNGNVTWYLRKLDVAHTLVASGTARTVDGYNVLDQQYFALDLEQEAAVQRVVESLADQVAQQLAIFFRRQAAGEAPVQTGPTQAPPLPPQIGPIVTPNEGPGLQPNQSELPGFAPLPRY